MLEFDINGLNNAWENTKHVVEYQTFSAGSSPTRLFLDTSIRLFRDVEPPSSQTLPLIAIHPTQMNDLRIF